MPATHARSAKAIPTLDDQPDSTAAVRTVLAGGRRAVGSARFGAEAPRRSCTTVHLASHAMAFLAMEATHALRVEPLGRYQGVDAGSTTARRVGRARDERGGLPAMD